MAKNLEQNFWYSKGESNRYKMIVKIFFSYYSCKTKKTEMRSKVGVKRVISSYAKYSCDHLGSPV